MDMSDVGCRLKGMKDISQVYVRNINTTLNGFQQKLLLNPEDIHKIVKLNIFLSVKLIILSLRKSMI